ncbi:MAG TPA: MarR family transcriptional regulator [Gemmatimonas sp.]|uniref:MarR family winged helix-turn-helix transcriptional regulator n=1 Tax=Gemmatimonas sp. TaxID=1962908 RepID=UPI002ED85D5C
MTVRGFARVHVVGDDEIGQEARASADDHSAVRLWLRLLSCSVQVEQHIRVKLRERFGTTLPRFDYLAQLDRHPDGLRLNALSRYLMVTGGNVTALTNQLIVDGLIERLADPTDGRSSIVRFTKIGRRRFQRMAVEHEQWLVDLFDGFDAPHRDTLYALLGRLRVHVAEQRPVSPSRKERQT